MLLTHWLTLFERDWQFALDVRTSRGGQTPSPRIFYRGKLRTAAKHHVPPIPPARKTALPYHWKARRRQCSSS
jgi:hypothetical protein